MSVCCLSVCVSWAGKIEVSGGKLISPKKSSLLSALVPCPGTEKYLQGGMGEIMGAVNEKCGGASDGVIDGGLTRGNC